jgi:hypothetical protein
MEVLHAHLTVNFLQLLHPKIRIPRRKPFYANIFENQYYYVPNNEAYLLSG